MTREEKKKIINDLLTQKSLAAATEAQKLTLNPSDFAEVIINDAIDNIAAAVQTLAKLGYRRKGVEDIIKATRQQFLRSYIKGAQEYAETN